jgi:hypothetical protein
MHAQTESRVRTEHAAELWKHKSIQFKREQQQCMCALLLSFPSLLLPSAALHAKMGICVCE